jgi:hypothetical protein
MKTKLAPALALFLIAPLFGEMISGSTPLNEYVNPVTFITLSLLYGCGAIIVRELVVRWRAGWQGLLLLGVAYGIYEEGILVQSFFDPGWQDLGELGVYGRAAGVNWVWTELLIVFHAAISIAASIACVHALYPDRRDQPWITNRRWWVANWIGLLALTPIWTALIQYDAGAWWYLAWLAVIVLVAAARWVRPDASPAPAAVPTRPHWFWLTGFLATLIVFLYVYGSGESKSVPFQLTLLILAAFIITLIRLLKRMSGAFQAWDDRHRIALTNGSLMFFLLIVPLSAGAQYPITYFTNPVLFIALWWAYRRIEQRCSAPDAPAAAGVVNA